MLVAFWVLRKNYQSDLAEIWQGGSQWQIQGVREVWAKSPCTFSSGVAMKSDFSRKLPLFFFLKNHCVAPMAFGTLKLCMNVRKRCSYLNSKSACRQLKTKKLEKSKTEKNFGAENFKRLQLENYKSQLKTNFKVHFCLDEIYRFLIWKNRNSAFKAVKSPKNRFLSLRKVKKLLFGQNFILMYSDSIQTLHTNSLLPTEIGKLYPESIRALVRKLQPFFTLKDATDPLPKSAQLS